MTLAIRAGQVFDGTAFRGPAAVLLDGPLLVDVVDPEAVPAGVEVHDLPGATVLPGLVDTHVHLCGDGRLKAMDRAARADPTELDAIITRSLGVQLAAGVTTVRDLGDTRFAVVDRRDRQRRHEPDEPTVVAAGPALTSPGGHAAALGGVVSGRAEILAAVQARVDRRVDVIKVMGSGGLTTWGSDVAGCQFSDDELGLIVSTAHGAGLPVTVHAHSLASVRQALRAGVDGLEHCGALTETGFDLPDDTLAALVAQDVVLGGCLAHSSADVLTMAPPTVLAMMRRAGVGPRDFDEGRAAMLRRVFLAGITIGVGTDGGVTSGRPHGGAAADAATVLRIGGDTRDAAAAATSVGAGVCGLGDRKGRLAPGFDADMLVADGDVAGDITALQRVLAVYKAGVPVIGR
ncbi:amidohydrolase family protein [Nakamurella flavida]|uniref:Amidohydrolase family protein n=1 Tax=Nakamurella flavida TaxID=363630 RepID=A0A938YLD9_9ACTN|nr:amidohydrolase family protein [Nakamurella flavida]MBM9476681.1 amidohydrolase family protein [Nakamurella flavida]MDP9778881.1 imidazolonepropionase-like amidohydrolase [Nakamurella flavida]